MNRVTVVVELALALALAFVSDLVGLLWLPQAVNLNKGAGSKVVTVRCQLYSADKAIGPPNPNPNLIPDYTRTVPGLHTGAANLHDTYLLAYHMHANTNAKIKNITKPSSSTKNEGP